MGTRSVTYVYDESLSKDETLVCLYCQYDGGIEGNGKKIADFLKSTKLTDGVRTDKIQPDMIYANGMQELACHFVYFFKKDNLMGNVYLVNHVKYSNFCHDYEYHIGEDYIQVKDMFIYPEPKIIFEGTWKNYIDFVNNYKN